MPAGFDTASRVTACPPIASGRRRKFYAAFARVKQLVADFWANEKTARQFYITLRTNPFAKEKVK